MTAKNSDCIFCKIAKGIIPTPKLYEDGDIFCIADIHPHAKTHLLIIPKEHIESLDEAFPVDGEQNTVLLGRMFSVATRVARENGLLPGGFRSVINTGANGGQTVHHLHLHILGGEPLQARMG